MFGRTNEGHRALFLFAPILIILATGLFALLHSARGQTPGAVSAGADRAAEMNPALRDDPAAAHAPRPFECEVIDGEEAARAIEEAVQQGRVVHPAQHAPPLQPALIASQTDRPPCTELPTEADIHSFEDSAGLLLTDFTDGELFDLMTDAANEVIAVHGDHFDFIAFFVNFVPDHQIGSAFYLRIFNDTAGLGQNIFDSRDDIGLASNEVEGYVMMWNVNSWTGGSSPLASFTRLVLGQEFEHRFAMFLPDLLDGRRLQGEPGCGRSAHWNWKVDGQGSAMEISEWVGSAPADLACSFVCFNTDIGNVFSFTDLYLMGYVTPAEMDAGNSDLRYMEDSCDSPYNGPISSFNSVDVVASAGRRDPGFGSAQKHFRTAWVMIHQPDAPPTSTQRQKAAAILAQHTLDWNAGTLGRGTMCNVLAPPGDDLPKFAQRPFSEGENVPSNIDWTNEFPNVVVADDFVSDDRPITAVRWWGGRVGELDPFCGDEVVNQPDEECDGPDDDACPSECRSNCTCLPPPSDFQLDDGTSESCVGFTDAEGNGLPYGWANRFSNEAGEAIMLEAITVAFGCPFPDDNVEVGDAVDAVIWVDAGATEQIANATKVVQWSLPAGVHANDGLTLATYPIPDGGVAVPAGADFYVGLGNIQTEIDGEFRRLAAIDSSSNAQRSWIFFGSPTFDPDNLGGQSVFRLSGNWLIRAELAEGGTAGQSGAISTLTRAHGVQEGGSNPDIATPIEDDRITPLFSESTVLESADQAASEDNFGIGNREGRLEKIRHEVPNDPPAPQALLDQRTVSPGAIIARGTFTSVQVNLDAAGNNFVGDAANEPSIAVDPTDPARMAIGWRQFDTIASDFRQAGLGYSQDGGLTWTFPGVLDPGQFRSDPVLGSDADGNFYYSSLSALDSAEVFKSTDGGVNWGPPVPAFGGDKQWMAVDRTAGIGSGNVYQIWNVQFSCCPPNDFTRSTDGGASFEGPFALATPSMKWGTLDVGPDGTLYAAGATLSQSGHLFTKSVNAQDPGDTPTFEPVQSVNLGGTTGIFGAPNPAGLLGQVWIATDHSGGPTHGNIYILASVNPPGLDPLDVMFIRSTDGGATWSDPVRVNDDHPATHAWQWFGTMSVAPNGRIDAVWNDTRNTSADNLTETFYAFSMDAGETWSRNVPLTPVFDSHLGFPQQDKLGDYYDMISDTDGVNLAYAATFNGEQDVYFLRIEADCNDNGVPDDQDIVLGNSEDCDDNGIPDECQLDCNENGIADRCDLESGDSGDCNDNRIPDECESGLAGFDCTSINITQGSPECLEARISLPEGNLQGEVTIGLPTEPPTLSVPYANSQLPSSIDISGLVPDAYELCVTATEENPEVVPEAIVFEALNSSCAPGGVYEFFLNGVFLGSTDADPTDGCTCAAPIQEFPVTDPGLLNAWNIGGVNELRVTMSGGAENLAWLRAGIEFGEVVNTTCIFDTGSQCQDPSLCNHSFVPSPVDATAQVVFETQVACRLFTKDIEDRLVINTTCEPPPAPDGFLLSFHEPKSIGGSAQPLLALYFCEASVVQQSPTLLISCDGHEVTEYVARLSDCCLIHAGVDSRSGTVPATKEAFLEEQCFDYALDVQAVVGVRFEQDPVTLECIEQPTEKTAAADFWGWHTSNFACGAGSSILHQSALQTSVTMMEDDWLYGPWEPIAPVCSQPNMAFELLTTEPPVTTDENGNCVPDKCEDVCQVADGAITDEIQTVISTKNRFLTISTGDEFSVNRGRNHAIRVIIESLPSPYDGLAPAELWVGIPTGTGTDVQRLSSIAGTGLGGTIPASDTRFTRVAQLRCGPPTPQSSFFRDWTDLHSCRGGDNNAADCVTNVDCPGGTCERDAFLHLYHPLIIPGGEYRVEVIDESCDPSLPGDFSVPLLLETARFGDVAGGTNCSPPAENTWCAPDGNTVVGDVVAAIDTFGNKPIGPIKPRAEAAGLGVSPVDGIIGVSDLVIWVDAVLGKPMTATPMAPPIAPPCP